MNIPNILIIEDNQFNHELVDYLLKSAGYITRSAWDGLEGITMIHEQHPDLILCDLQMPVMTGYDVVMRTKSDELLNSIPIVAVTASSMLGDLEKVLAAGFDGYIPKPIEPRTFVKQIEEFLPLNLRLSLRQ